MIKLKKILEEKNIKQKDLSKLIKEKTGVIYSKSTISKFCNGYFKNITVKTALILSKSLDVPVGDLINDFDEIKPNIDNYFP